MASSIDVTKPVAGTPTTASVRANFLAAKNEIEALQAGTGLAANAVTNAKFRQSAGLSLVGRSANSTGDVADITAANDGEVMRRSGTSIGFGTVAAAGLASDSVITVKILDANVTDAKISNRAAVSVFGRSANSGGVGADIAAGANDRLLRRVADALDFGQLTVGMFPASVITYAKIQDVSATDKILGRSTAGAGVVEEIACTAAGRALLDDASAGAQRNTLGSTTVGDAVFIAASAAAARTAIGTVIGTDVQAYHARLADLAGITYAQGDILYYDGANLVKLAKGTDGQFLKITATIPAWASVPGGGDMLAANNLSDVASAATAFGNIKQAATDSATGVVELATSAEVTTGTDTGRVLTPATAGLRSAIISFTRDLSAASGNVAYTGVGFTPKAILFMASVPGITPFSIGATRPAGSGETVFFYANNTTSPGGNALMVYGGTLDGTNHQDFVVNSFDSDGFTLAYTKVNSPTGTATIKAWCLR